MCRRTSSGVRLPVSSSSAARARCRSASTNSSAALVRRRLFRRTERLTAPLEQIDMSAVCHRRRVAQRLATRQDIAQPRPHPVEALTCPRRDLNDGRLSFERQRPAWPARRLIHLVHHHETPHGSRLLQHRPILLVERLRPVNHDERGRRDAQRLTRPGHAFNLHCVPGRPDTGRVNEGHRQPVQIGHIGHQVPRRPGHRCDDRTRHTQQPVEETRLAHVRLPHDDDLTSFADQPPPRRPVQQRVDLPPDGTDRLGHFSRRDEVIALPPGNPARPPAWRSGRTTGCRAHRSAQSRCLRAGRTRRAPVTASPRR